MQQVAQAATHPTIALANAKTIQNKQYNKISPPCAAINLMTRVKACQAWVAGRKAITVEDVIRMRHSGDE